jgi:ligand-binding sensor domain-containing protein
VDGLVNNHVNTITPLKNGAVWIAAEGGASLWDGSKWVSYTERNGLVNNNVYKIAPGLDESLWFATEGGVSHFFPGSDKWINYTTKDGLADDFVTYAAVTPDGSIWFPTVTEGMSRLIIPASVNAPPSWKTYSEYSEGDTQIPFENIDQIQTAPDGTYWFAGLGGLMQFNPVTKTWTLLESYSKVGGSVSYFTFGLDGSMWVASGSLTPEVLHLNGQNQWEIYDSRDGLPTINKANVNEDGVVAIGVDPENHVWIATRENATRCLFRSK